MTEDVMPFSHYYKKFEHPLLCTIRRRDKYGDIGDKLPIKTNRKERGGYAGVFKIVGKEKRKLKNIPTKLLVYDTTTKAKNGDYNKPKNRKEAIDFVNQFYRKPLEPDEELTIYFGLNLDLLIGDF